MSDLSELVRFDWSTSEHTRIPGTEDWVEVAKVSSGSGYDWTDFNAYYSPSARRYFWHGDSGCSCNSWSEGVRSSEDLQNGSKDDLLRGWEAFAKEYDYAISLTTYLDGVETIKEFKVAK